MGRFRDHLQTALADLHIHSEWVSVEKAAKSHDELSQLVGPFLDNDDPVFGTRFTGSLCDFFQSSKLAALQPDSAAELTILYGCGAGLVDWDGPLIYVDLPKNELQYRSRAGAVVNLGAAEVETAKVQYKRFYFVDWPVLNQHKAEIVNEIDWFVDEQRPDQPTFISGEDLRSALDQMSSQRLSRSSVVRIGAVGRHVDQGPCRRITARRPQLRLVVRADYARERNSVGRRPSLDRTVVRLADVPQSPRDPR